MAVVIDPTARVSPKAQLGENVTIGPYSIIGEHVTIGDGCEIGSHVVIHCYTTMGKDCRVAPFASVGTKPQDLKYNNEPTTLEIGDRCDIREYVTLSRGTSAHGKTVIGNDCLFMANTHVAHDCIVGDHCILANSAALAGHVTLGNWVILGGLTPVHQFVRIGDHAMVGGGYRVPKDIPPYVRAGREPMSYEGLNIVGLKRRGFTNETIALIDKTYTILYLSNLNVSQAVQRIKQEVPLIPEVQNILDFIAKSQRGIMPGPRLGR
ncbi:MAG: acyl-ACP--UDP-N-acetylglucosamine O-acyltransferase [Bacteroidetes bacterium]|nr:acyl-ACP--UDP-N-acetylglucosamine O-acyltransferase [Bacteroidota bacterium]